MLYFIGQPYWLAFFIFKFNKGVKKTTKKYTPEALLTVEELAQELKAPPSWIYSRTRQKGPDAIPVIRVGKYCRFQLADVLAWLERKNMECENA